METGADDVAGPGTDEPDAIPPAGAVPVRKPPRVRDALVIPIVVAGVEPPVEASMEEGGAPGEASTAVPGEEGGASPVADVGASDAADEAVGTIPAGREDGEQVTQAGPAVRDPEPEPARPSTRPPGRKGPPRSRRTCPTAMRPMTRMAPRRWSVTRRSTSRWTPPTSPTSGPRERRGWQATTERA